MILRGVNAVTKFNFKCKPADTQILIINMDSKSLRAFQVLYVKAEWSLQTLQSKHPQ